MSSRRFSTFRLLALALVAGAAIGWTSGQANGEALLLVEADSGKVLHAENATYPWYPASVTKLMTVYTTLRALRQGRITLGSLFTVSANAAAQSPTKMGFPIGTQVTVDNAIKMLMVKSANDMAVLLAEGVSGSIENFAAEMNANAMALGMTQTNYVNPNGLPADEQVTSARDLAILARALIHEFPEYDAYWHLPGIKFGKRVVRNYNTLLGRYPGADGMKTGFICASGFNLVATATRDGRRLIAVVLGAPSAAVRAEQAARLLEQGFGSSPLSWLTPSLGLVSSLTPVDAAPANLHEEMCGPRRKRPASEEEEEANNPPGDSPYAVLLSSLKPQPKGNLLQQDATLGEPVVVYTGPARGQGPALAAVQVADPKAARTGKKAAGLKPDPAAATPPEPAPASPPVASAGLFPWASLSPSTLSASPPPELAPAASPTGARVPLPRARPRLPIAAAVKPPSQ